MMVRYIDADALEARMYHDAFETDSDMQKWDGGCWIRYKMFENAIGDAPTADVISKNEVDDILAEISYCVWEEDIQSPTVREEREHHDSIQKILAFIEQKHNELRRNRNDKR